MAVPVNIEDLINQRIIESNRIEFKADYNPAPIIRSICANDIDNTSNIPFDDRPNLAADITDVDIGLLRAHLKEIGSDLYLYAASKDVLEIALDMQPQKYRTKSIRGQDMHSFVRLSHDFDRTCQGNGV